MLYVLIKMTKITLSIIFAIIFIVASFSKPMIPCTIDNLTFCTLDGEQSYYGSDKLSNPWIGGGISFTIIFFISLTILNLIFPKKNNPYTM